MQWGYRTEETLRKCPYWSAPRTPVSVWLRVTMGKRVDGRVGLQPPGSPQWTWTRSRWALGAARGAALEPTELASLRLSSGSGNSVKEWSCLHEVKERGI